MARQSRNDNGLLETVVKVHAPDLGVPHEACIVDKPMEPFTLVIFGASGDLTTRKLIPALYRLYVNKGINDPFSIVGCARTPWNDEQFRERARESLTGSENDDLSGWAAFSNHLHYQTITYDALSTYRDLAAILRQLDLKCGTQGNRIFYLATPPSLYMVIGEMLGQAGLSAEGKNENGWSRLVVEKPFGRDLKTALELDQSLHGSFQENQIYRMDHYLAKQTVQNVLVFRFANAIFEPPWSRRYVSQVRIIAAETLGVEHRAGYYEQAGVLRDMFQNHMMQLLSMTAMEPPPLFDTEQVRDERTKVFQFLRPFTAQSISQNLVLGQYTAGTVDGRGVPGYREEPGVSPVSMTPTFAAMRVFIDNRRWQDVPFYLVSGKRLAKKLTEIAIQFKEVPHSMFKNVLGDVITANRLTLGIQPDEKITLTFQTKNPGATFCLRSVTMDFDYHQNYRGPLLDAYEKALLDCIQGDHMLFLREDGVERCWAFLTPILEGCETCQLRFYESGSWGPASTI